MSEFFTYDAREANQDVKTEELNSASALSEFEKISTERKLSVERGETPEFFISQGYMMFTRKYSHKGETIKEAYTRVANKLSTYYTKDPELAKQKFFDIMWKGHLAPSTPVLNNTGLDKGHSVSCSGGYIGDTIHDFYTSLREAAVLSQKGYGTSGYLGDIRARGTPISSGGFASGVVPVFENFVSMSNKISQGSNRRGQWAGYIGVMHDDFDELWDYVFKNPGIANVGWLYTQADIEALNRGEEEIVRRTAEVLYLRSRFGKGYIVKPDTANELSSQAIKNSGIPIKSSNLCVTGDTLLHTDNGMISAKELYDNQTMFSAVVDSRSEIEKYVAANGDRDTYKTNRIVGESLVKLHAESTTTTRSTNGMHLTAKNVPIFNIMTSSGYSLNGTEYHNFFVYDTKSKSITKKSMNTINTKFDKILLQSAIGEFGNKGNFNIGYLLGLMINGHVTNNQSEVPILANRLNGLDLATVLKETDCKSDNLVTFGSYNSPNVNIKTILSDLKFDGYINSIYNNDADKYTSFTINRETLLSIMGEELSDIGKYLQRASLNTVKGFITAIYELYGVVNNTHLIYSLDIRNRELVELLQLLLINFGIKSNRNNYTLTVSSYDLAKLRSYFDLVLPTDIMNENELLMSYQAEDSYEDILHIINTGKTEDVYDTTQAHSHSLIFNGIVTGNCTEIFLPQNEEYSFSCVLSSLNLSKWDEFEEDTIYWATIFLDCVCSITIEQTANNPDIANIHRFTKDFRALGLGALGWHTYLQSKMLPFDSLQAKILNKQIFAKIKSEAVRASEDLAKMNGEPKFCKGTGRANATLLAIAPNTSSALLVGGVSQGIEPIAANVFNQNTAAGEVTRMNPLLLNYLKENGLYSDKLMEDIAINYQGSVQHIEELPQHVRDVFKTAYEINQYAVISQASDRQPSVCQGQSLNNFFKGSGIEEYITDITLQVLNDDNVKAAYYQRGMRSVRASNGECVACEG